MPTQRGATIIKVFTTNELTILRSTQWITQRLQLVNRKNSALFAINSSEKINGRFEIIQADNANATPFILEHFHDTSPLWQESADNGDNKYSLWCQFKDMGAFYIFMRLYATGTDSFATNPHLAVLTSNILTDR